jgi:WhiB family redox-sensing transcriptional regulator
MIRKLRGVISAMTKKNNQLETSKEFAPAAASRPIRREAVSELGASGMTLAKEVTPEQMILAEQPTLSELIPYMKERLQLSASESLALRFFLDPEMQAENTQARMDALAKMRNELNAVFEAQESLITPSHEELLGVIFALHEDEERHPVSMRMALRDIPQLADRRAFPGLVYAGLSALLTGRSNIPKVHKRPIKAATDQDALLDSTEEDALDTLGIPITRRQRPKEVVEKAEIVRIRPTLEYIRTQLESISIVQARGRLNVFMTHTDPASIVKTAHGVRMFLEWFSNPDQDISSLAQQEGISVAMLTNNITRLSGFALSPRFDVLTEVRDFEVYLTAKEEAKPSNANADTLILEKARRALQLSVLKKNGWQEKANCAGSDSDLFFSENKKTLELGKKVCTGCEVKDACLQHATSKSIFEGTWGGYTQYEREELRERAAEAKSRRSRYS